MSVRQQHILLFVNRLQPYHDGRTPLRQFTLFALEDLRIAGVVKQDVTTEKGKVTGYRVRLTISFKYHPSKG